MKATGIVRRVDILGRIVIPIEIRRNLGIKSAESFNPGDSLEFFSDEDAIVLKKYQPACVFCNNADDVVEYKGKMVCRKCIEELK